MRTIQNEAQEVIGVLFTKNTVNRGQKPSVRTDFGMCSVGNEFYISCGQATKTCNDVRCFQLVEGDYAEWRINKTDSESFDLCERIGHSFESFSGFFVIFGGAGPY